MFDTSHLTPQKGDEKAGKARSRSVSPAKRKSSLEIEFAKLFGPDDEYGRYLMDIEERAYKQTFKDPNKKIVLAIDERCDRYVDLACKRGIGRAEKQIAMNIVADGSEQPQRRSASARGASIGRGASANSSHHCDEHDFVHDALPPSQRSSGKRKASNELTTSRKKMARSPNRTPSPSKSNSRTSAGTTALLEEREPSAPKRGPVHSSTNPQTIPETTKKNPFFESMPAPEVWHRRMPPYFSFGETPYMERVISNQINADLAGSE